MVLTQGTSGQDGANGGGDLFRVLQIAARLLVDISAINYPNLAVSQKDIIEVKIFDLPLTT